MGAAVDHVQHRHGQGRRLLAAEVAEEREPGIGGGRLRHGERDAENRVRAEPALVRRAVELDQPLVERALVGGVQAAHRLGDLAVDVADRLPSRPCRPTPGRRRAARAPRARRSRRPRELPRGRSRPTPATPRPPRSGCRASRGSAARACARWPSCACLLGEVEVAVLLVECELRPALAVLSASRSARSTRATKRSLIIRSASSGSTFRRRATLTEAKSTSPSSSKTCGCGSVSGAGSPPPELGLQLAHLVVEVRDRALDVRILEADGAGATLHLAGIQQRRQRVGDVVEDALALLLLALDPLPVLAHAAGCPRLDLTEDVRVPADELLVHARATASRSPSPCSASSSERK